MAKGILPNDSNGPTFPFGNDEARKQRDQFDGDAKEFVSGDKTDSDDGGPLEGADVTAKGGKAPAKGKSFSV